MTATGKSHFNESDGNEGLLPCIRERDAVAALPAADSFRAYFPPTYLSHIHVQPAHLTSESPDSPPHPDTMFVKDVRRDFYDKVVRSKALVLVSFDTDAICALKILQFLFETDNVQYTVIPVTTVDEVRKTFTTHKNNIQTLVLINAGSSFDVIEELDVDPDSGISIFVADSHRPINHFNIFRNDQVYLLMDPADNEKVPAYEDVINDDSESDSEDEDVSRLSLAELERRQQRRSDRMRWATNAEDLLYQYYKFSYFGESVAEMFFNLAWKLSRDSNQLLWFAIIGVFDQFVNEKIDSDRFMRYTASLQSHVSRLSHLREERATGVLSELNHVTTGERGDAAENNNADNHNPITSSSSSSGGPVQLKNQALILSFTEDLRLVLYRHWSVYESMRHTVSVCSRFKVWTPRGYKQLLEFLAKLGIPLTQSKQKFTSMEMEYKKNLKEWIENLVSEYQLEDLIGNNFIACKGYKFKYSAADVALGVRALLESGDKEKTANENFLDALDSLSWSKTDLLETGIEMAKTQLIAILKQVHHILDLNTIQKAGPFLYCILKESTPDVRLFGHPAVLMNLARFLLNAFVVNTKFSGADSLPLVLIVPDMNQPGSGLVTGIQPVGENSPHNFFGEVFNQLQAKISFELTSEFYDRCVVRMSPFNDNTCGEVIEHLTLLLNDDDDD